MRETTKIEVAQKCFNWCKKKFGSPISETSKKAYPSLILVPDRRRKRLYGEYSPSKIKIFLNVCQTKKDIVSTIIHEYTHFLQMPKSIKPYHKIQKDFEYSDNPFEKEAVLAESKFTKKCLKQIKKK